MNEQSGDFDLPLARPAPDAPVATLWVVLTALFHGEPATRAGNPGFARGSKPFAEVYTAARLVEWLIRYQPRHVQTLMRLTTWRPHYTSSRTNADRAAVSARKTRGPSVTGVNPHAAAAVSSAALRPPSGPDKKVVSAALA